MKKNQYLFIASLLLVLFASAQQSIEKKFESFNGQKGIKKKISDVKESTVNWNPRKKFSEEELEEIEAKEEQLKFRLDNFKEFKEIRETKEKKIC